MIFSPSLIILALCRQTAGFSVSSSCLFSSTIDQQEGLQANVISSFPGGLTAIRVEEGDGDLIGHVVNMGGVEGIVVVHRPPVAFCYSTSPIKGSTAQVLPQKATMSDSEYPIFAPIPKVSEIALINEPLLTGVTMMDVLAPMGKGQNMLIVGSDHQQLQGYTRSLLKTQLEAGTICVYASTSTLENRQSGVEYLSTAPCNDEVSHAAEAVVKAAEACALAEKCALQGKDALVVVDTVDSHKNLWDCTTRVLLEEFGTEAVVQGDINGAASSEMRAFFSTLVQRAGHFNSKKGGGSVSILLIATLPETDSEDTEFTIDDFSDANEKIRERIQLLSDKMIPLTASTLRKIQIPVPSVSEGKRRLALQHLEDLHSMTDGMIWLDEERHYDPPLDPQRSVTRIGIGADTKSRADAPALRKMEGLRLALSQAESMQGAEETPATMKQRIRKDALLFAMTQKSDSEPRRLSESCAVLLAATEGFLDPYVTASAPDDDDTTIPELLAYLHENVPDPMLLIDESLDLTDHTKDMLIVALKAWSNLKTE